MQSIGRGSKLVRSKAEDTPTFLDQVLFPTNEVASRRVVESEPSILFWLISDLMRWSVLRPSSHMECVCVSVFGLSDCPSWYFSLPAGVWDQTYVRPLTPLPGVLRLARHEFNPRPWYGLPTNALILTPLCFLTASCLIFWQIVYLLRTLGAMTTWQHEKWRN